MFIRESEGASKVGQSPTLLAVSKLLVDTGKACQYFHDESVHGLNSTRIEADEIWSFIYAKQKNVADMVSDVEGAGDVWAWTAIDAPCTLFITTSLKFIRH